MAQALLGDWLAGGEHDGSLRAMPADEFLGSADLDEAAVFDDRHPVAQPLGILHESGVPFVGMPTDRLANSGALNDATRKVRGAPRKHAEEGKGVHVGYSFQGNLSRRSP